LFLKEKIMYRKNKKRGQSTVEYVLLMTAVVAVIIAFVSTKNNGGLQDQLGNNLNTVVGDIGDMGTRLSGSHAAAPGNATVTPDNYVVDVTNGV
jgi:Flp pilus assembly pilin Flp